jgi:OOP family OmpA-OmpF porin
MSFANAAMAQDYDDRWYITAGAAYNFQDEDRDTDSDGELNLGFGKFWSPLWSVDFQLNWLNPQKEGTELNFSQYGASVDFRRHWPRETWSPYLVGGIGIQRSEEEYDNFPNPDSPAQRESTNLATKLGAGVQFQTGPVDLRVETGVRFDFNDDSQVAPDDDYFTDYYASLNVLFPLGERAAVVTPVAAPDCSSLDDDGDGVNNCNDKCPGSAAGQAIGPDGCPVPLTIDLKGVNFDFDKDTLRPDAVAILDEAVTILQRYPQLRVEVAGHTDSIGTEQYNQGLSERRARAVYDYLTSHGIDASRLAGPNGYGESRPIAPNTNPDGSDNPEGRARNRRTELNVQN